MREKLRVVIAGEVDHGKSTILGRLLYETGSLLEGKIEELNQICETRATDTIEWSFLLDAFQAERDQAITIDSTQISFSTPTRDYVMIDAPGHVQFLKNMMSGAGEADAAILVVEAGEGVREQTKRHAQLLALLGLKQVAVVVNKMDAVKYSPGVFGKISKEIRAFLETMSIEPVCVMPLVARSGEMIVTRGNNMNWYKSKTLLEALDYFEKPQKSVDEPLRFWVQDVYRFDGKRIIVGHIESGTLKIGDELFFSPFNQQARVESIETWPASKKTEACAGEMIGLTLDERIFVERGHVGAHESALPPLSNVFNVEIFWLADAPPALDKRFRVRFGSYETIASIQEIKTPLEKNRIGMLTLRARGHVPIDTGQSVIIENDTEIVAAGTLNLNGFPNRRHIHTKSENIQKESHLLTAAMRAGANGYSGGVFWLTGLPGAGKSTIAMALERALFERGLNAYVLDGDNLRHGLSADLGFSPVDRAENIRRAGHVAALMAEAGLIVIASFISPYRADREAARNAAGGQFSEIYIHADPQICEARDPKGLYKKARAGKITGFTGIDSPYEVPEAPDLVIDTQNNGINQCVRQLLDFVETRISLSPQVALKEKIFVVQ